MLFVWIYLGIGVLFGVFEYCRFGGIAGFEEISEILNRILGGKTDYSGVYLAIVVEITYVFAWPAMVIESIVSKNEDDEDEVEPFNMDDEDIVI